VEAQHETRRIESEEAIMDSHSSKSPAVSSVVSFRHSLQPSAFQAHYHRGS
jgi:hypothetical protein